MGFSPTRGFLDGLSAEILPPGRLQLHSISPNGRFLAGERKTVDDWEAIRIDTGSGELLALGDGHRAASVNDRGELAGHLIAGYRLTHGFLYREGHKTVVEQVKSFKVLDHQGRAAGTGQDDRATVWQGNLRSLDLPAQFDSSAVYDLADERLVGACHSGPLSTPVAWSWKGEVEFLAPDRGGVALSTGRDLVVGFEFPAPPLGYDRRAPWAVLASAEVTAFCWQKGQLRSLEAPEGWTLKVVCDINARGQMVGWATHQDSPRLKRAFRLDPMERTEGGNALRPAMVEDVDKMLALLPHLAAFELADWRDPRHLYTGDGHILKRWADGLEPHLRAIVAESDGQLVGLAFFRLGDELLSRSPSAHLEVLVVSPAFRSRGLGRSLVTECERMAREEGALTMSLHVFGSNQKARALYRACGYEEELIRSIKRL